MSRTKYTSFNLRRPRISMYSLRTGSLRTHVTIPPVRLAAILPTLVASRRHPPRHSPLLTSTTVFSTNTTSSRHHLAIHIRRSRIQIYSRSAASAGLPTTRTMLVIYLRCALAPAAASTIRLRARIWIWQRLPWAVRRAADATTHTRIAWN